MTIKCCYSNCRDLAVAYIAVFTSNVPPLFSSHYHCHNHIILEHYRLRIKYYWYLDTKPTFIPGENIATDDCVFDMLMRMVEIFKLGTESNARR